MSTGNRPKVRAGAEFFRQPATAAHRQYEALRAYFVEGLPAAAVAKQFGYTTAAVYALCRDFRARRLAFFRTPAKPGPKHAPKRAAARQRVIQLRQQHYSAYDIQQRLRAEGLPLSVTVIDQLLREEGFAKLPRRRQVERERPVRPERAAATTIEAVDWNSWQSIKQFQAIRHSRWITYGRLVDHKLRCHKLEFGAFECPPLASLMLKCCDPDV